MKASLLGLLAIPSAVQSLVVPLAPSHSVATCMAPASQPRLLLGRSRRPKTAATTMISIGPVSVGKLPVIVAGAAVVFVVAKGGPALLGLATGGAKKGYDDDMARYDEMIRRLSAPKGAPTAVASRARASPPKADEPVPPPTPVVSELVEKPKKAKPAGIGLFKRKHVRPLDIDDVLGADGPAAACPKPTVCVPLFSKREP